MAEKSILVPVDLTSISKKAAMCAARFAKINGMKVTLLHIQSGNTDQDITDELTSMAHDLETEFSIRCECLIRVGNIFSEIAKEANDRIYRFMVIGSHGFKGFKEKLLGADILKLVKNIPVPVLAIQEGFTFPEDGIKTIVFPVGSHEAFQNQIDATIYIARMFDSEVHIYSIEKPGFDWSESLKTNIEKTIKEFETAGTKFKRISEAQNTYSPGYAKQILTYAGKIKADLIAVMSIPTNEHYYIADGDKERLLTNDLNIPVLCASDKKQV